MSSRFSLIEVTPEVTASSAYTSLDQVGGIMQLPRKGVPGAGRILRSLMLVNDGAVAFGWEMYFYNALPSLTSSDHEALAYTTAAELDKVVAVMSSENQKTGGFDAGASQWAHANFERFPGGLFLGNAETIYVVARTNETPTLAATDAVRWVFGIEEIFS